MKTVKRVRLFSFGTGIVFAIFLIAVWLKTTQEQKSTVRDPLLLLAELFPLSTYPDFKPDETATTKCSTVSEDGAKTKNETKLIPISDATLTDLHMSLKEVTVNVADLCLRSGQAIVLTSTLEKDVTIFRATAMVKTANGDQATLIIGNRWLGKDGFLAPSCYTFCDGIVNQLTTDSNVIQLDLREKMYDRDRPLSNAASISYGTPEVILKKIESAIGKIQDRNFVLVARGPQVWRKNMTATMQALKTRGAKSVYWLYKGVSGLNRIPITPPMIDGVSEIHSFEASMEIGAGAIPLFVVHSDLDPKSIESKLPHTMLIIAFDPDLQPFVAPDKSYIEKGMTMFDLRQLPRDKSTKFIIYGESGFDWRAYHLVRELQRRGYKSLTYLRGGISEWEEALELSAVPQT